MKYLTQNLLKVIALICICSIQNTMAQVSSKTIFLNGNLSFRKALLHSYVGNRLTVLGIPNLVNRFKQVALIWASVC